MSNPNRGITAFLSVAVALLALWTVGCDTSTKHAPDDENENENKRSRPRKKLKRPGGYLHTVVRAGSYATLKTCLMRMSLLKQELMLYTHMNDGKFPASLAELNRPKMIHTPMRGQEEYFYIPGQSAQSDPANILIYLEEVDHKGKCHILRVGGTPEAIEPDELEAELRRTRERLKRR